MHWLTHRKQQKLDGQGRARREAARRRKSEWKVNLAIPNSSRSNGSWQITPKTVSLSIVEPRGIWTCVSLQCTSTLVGQYARYNVFVCGSKFITRLVVRIPPLSPKWGLIRWILGQIFNFHDQKFFWGVGGSSPFWCALTRLGQSLALMKIWGGSTP